MTFLPRFSVKNPILVNLLMFAVLVGGIYCAATVVREFFPEVRPNAITVTTIYPGATPAEVEKGISARIEEETKDIEGVAEIRTNIGEGFSMITLELRHDVDDVDRAVNDVKAAVDAIPRDELPRESEETIVTKFVPKLPVISISLFGRVPEAVLKRAGRTVRDELLLIDDISDVTLSGTRKDELRVEVRPEKLVQYGLSFMDVADAVRRANLDLPGGQIKLAGANVAVRTLGEEDRAEGLEQIIVRSDVSGRVVRLHAVADLVDGFEDVDVIGRFNGMPAVTVTVFKTADQDAIEISEKIHAYVAGKTGAPLERDWTGRFKSGLATVAAEMYAAWKDRDESDDDAGDAAGAAPLPRGDEIDRIYRDAQSDPLPPRISLAMHNNLARFIEGRLDLLKRNGLWGLTFVFLSLVVFLNWRVALWVMVGLMLSILGTLLVMRATGVTLNLMSMFGMIVVLGMLVDDAIVVGENVFAKVEAGLDPHDAAIEGTQAVAWPVTVAILTTVVAFLPLMFIEGQMGDFMKVLPIIVCIALSISLVEALVILPSHLAEWLKPMHRSASKIRESGLVRLRLALRAWQDRILKRWLIGGYTILLRLAIRYRYVTVSILVAALMIVAGSVAGGHMPFVFIQKMDSETIVANLEMPIGTAMTRTDEAIRRVEREVMAQVEVESTQTLVGAQIKFDGSGVDLGSHSAQVIAELRSVEYREDNRQRNSEALLNALRKAMANLPGVDSLEFQAMHGGPGGAAIQVEITSERLDDLREVTKRIKARLASFEGVQDVVDDFNFGRRELQIRLRDSARALGLTTESLATQVRAAFYGLEVRKVQRDREDVRIMVRYPDAYRKNLYQVESLWIATPTGAKAPFCEVASLEEGTGYASIRRRDQRRAVTITADVDEDRGNAQEIIGALEAGFPALQAEFPGMRFRFGGQQREMRRSFGSLGPHSLLAMMLIYVLLAALFRSYVQPFVVMAAIPFGVVGAVLGHWFMGYPITMMSAIGLVALSGIVVNDSLILVNDINHRLRHGAGLYDAVIEGGRRRLRPILLTTITTVLGLAPLMAERSFQAKFLIPMGISISFGLLFATLLTLILVPCLYLMVEDAKRIWNRLGALALGPALPATGPR